MCLLLLQVLGVELLVLFELPLPLLFVVTTASEGGQGEQQEQWDSVELLG